MTISIIGAIKGAAEAIGSIISEPIKGWQERKTIKTQAKTEVEKLNAEAAIRKAELNIELAKTGQKIEENWDITAQKQMHLTWKDEYLVLLLFLPVLLLFLSAFLHDVEFQTRVINSVKALEEFPLWYVMLLCGIVAAVFGLRWMVAPMINRMKKGE